MTNRLKEIRSAQKLPVIGLSARSGVSTSTIMGIENWGLGTRPITMQKIAKALGTSVEEIWPDVTACTGVVAR